MRLLIITQKVDMNDPVLGFFCRWVEEFSKHCEKLTVIALGAGEYHLPANVKVLSLGKESGNFQYSILNFKLFKNISYIFKFYKYIWSERKNYDSVFAHMNQEYVLLGGFIWKILNKKTMLWRNHPNGNLFTGLSVFLSDRVFCTSRYSYTARFKKTEIMPVGIDMDLFKRRPEVKKIPNSILFLGRISPVKNIDLLIEAFNSLNKENFSFNAAIVGDVADKDRRYYESAANKVKGYGLEKRMEFCKAVAPKETPDLYNKYELFVNLTLTGSMDKTIFEAMACETPILTTNQSLKGFIDNVFIINENDEVRLASGIKEMLSLTEGERAELGKKLRKFAAENHGLEKLMKKILE